MLNYWLGVNELLVLSPTTLWLLREQIMNHKLTVSMAFPVLSSFNEGPLMSVSRKKYFPFTASVVAISLSSCMYQKYKHDTLKRWKKEGKRKRKKRSMGFRSLIPCGWEFSIWPGSRSTSIFTFINLATLLAYVYKFYLLLICKFWSPNPFKRFETLTPSTFSSAPLLSTFFFFSIFFYFVSTICPLPRRYLKTKRSSLRAAT